MTPQEINMADVAHRAGVSTATVSRALRGLPGVSSATRERVRAIAEELSYVVSPEASRLSGGRTGRVAVVVPRLDVWFYAAMLSAIETELAHADLDVLVYQVDGERQRGRFFRELPARRKVDAVVLTALPLLEDEAERLDLLGVEVVVAGGQIRDFPRVRVDDQGVARTAVEHLAGLGHRRIAMIRTSDTEGAHWSSDAERCRGYRQAVADHGLDADPDLLVTAPFEPGAGAAGMDRLLDLDEPPTAVFAYSDEIALAALQTLRRRHVQVPRDMSLVGVDGHPMAAVFDLTSVVQDVAEQGRIAGEMVLELLRGRHLDHPERVVGTRLVVRGSTAPPTPRVARAVSARAARAARAVHARDRAVGRAPSP